LFKYFQIGINVDYEVKEEYKLEINTPKFIGFQLGTLRASDNGMSLYRATKVQDGKFVFESIDVFNSGHDSEIENTDLGENDGFYPIDQSDYTDNSSIYLDHQRFDT